MRKALQWGVAVLAAWSVGTAVAAPAKAPAKARAPAAAPVVPVIEQAGYSFCANEAVDAMALGRMVMVFKRSREQVMADPSLPPYMRGMAADLFRGIDAGEAPTYAHFAARRFQGCLETQKVPLQSGDERTFACLTRVDIPYFFFVLKQGGEGREAAVAKLEKGLAGWRFPEALIPALAEPSWKANDLQEIRGLQLFLMSSCLLPPEEVAHFYGVSPPSANDAAGGAAAGAARGPAGGQGSQGNGADKAASPGKAGAVAP